MHYDEIAVPADGEQITVNPDGTINVPERPIIPFIEGDGIGVDVTPVMRKVVVHTIARKELSFDLARLRKAIRAPKLRHATDLQTVKEELEELVPGATLVGSSGFGDAVIRHMDD